MRLQEKAFLAGAGCLIACGVGLAGLATADHIMEDTVYAGYQIQECEKEVFRDSYGYRVYFLNPDRSLIEQKYILESDKPPVQNIPDSVQTQLLDLTTTHPSVRVVKDLPVGAQYLVKTLSLQRRGPIPFLDQQHKVDQYIEIHLPIIGTLAPGEEDLGRRWGYESMHTQR